MLKHIVKLGLIELGSDEHRILAYSELNITESWSKIIFR